MHYLQPFVLRRRAFDDSDDVDIAPALDIVAECD